MQNPELIIELEVITRSLRALSKRQSELYERIELSGSLDDLNTAIAVTTESVAVCL